MPIINGQGRIGVRVQVPLLLDTYTGAAAAYSLRKLTNTYNGSAIRVRRSSDNTEMNIGFNADGSLNTTALTTFVGAGNGFVVTWFDQSGNGRNGVSGYAFQQPYIVKNGSVMTTPNGKPAISAEPGAVGGFVTKYVQFNYGTSMFVGDPDQANITGSVRSGFIVVGDHYWETLTSYGVNGNAAMNYISNTRSYTGATADYSLFYTNFRNGNVYMAFNNGDERNLGTWSFTTPTAKALFKVYDQYGSYSYGKFNELILWTGDKSANRSAISSNINSYYSIYSPMDSDAQAFITAASITDSTQMSAVNTLVTSLKSAGLWTKMKAIYPFVGGTASAHKFNLKDPRDIDAAYRLVFNGGWTHSSTGALPNGTNGYADTKLVPSTQLSQNNNSFGFYSRTEVNGEYYDMGSYASHISVILARFGGNFYGANNDNGYDPSTNSSSLGLFISSRTGSTTKKGYRNSTEIQNSSRTSMGLPTASIFLGGISAYPGYSPREFAFSFIGDGLSSSDVTALNTAVQAFQTTLGRQVA